MSILLRKGFPESYNTAPLLDALNAIKSGKPNVNVPIYSHHTYDILPDQYETVNQPDIVILEGLNILQTGSRKAGSEKIFVSDFFDFSIFVDADNDIIKKWYINRVMNFYDSSFQQPTSYFHFLTKKSRSEVEKFAERVWNETNELNLIENILPFKDRARLILKKGENHCVERVYLRKL